MLEELGKQEDAEPVHVPARLVAGLVLIEADIGVDGGLADIETPSVHAAGVPQEHDIERMMRTPCACGRRAQLSRRPLGPRHPFRQSTTHHTTIVGLQIADDWAMERRDLVLVSFQKHSSVPIFNMESVLEHPCQAWGDALTLEFLN